MQKNKKIQIIYAPKFFNYLKDKHLLLDTSVFIDTLSHEKEFIDFFDKCKKNNTFLVTIDPVKIEFNRGAENQSRLKVKRQLINSIVDYCLPIHASVYDQHIPFLVEKYREGGKTVSLTDFFLGSLLIQHQKDLCLLTKNPKDFPLSIFQLKSYVILKMNRALQVYAVLIFKNVKKDSKKDKNFDKIPF